MDKFEVPVKSMERGKLESYKRTLMEKLRNTFRVTKPDSGPCPEGGEHEWVYSNQVLTSYPPKIPKICSECGEKRTESGGVIDDGPSYRELEKKFDDE